MVAENILEKDHKTITVGVDDTVKAAGRHVFDVKADHSIVSGPTTGRCTFTR